MDRKEFVRWKLDVSERFTEQREMKKTTELKPNMMIKHEAAAVV